MPVYVPDIKSEPLQDAWRRGFLARRMFAETMDDCPFPKRQNTDPRRKWWLHGWEQANANPDEWSAMCFSADEAIELGLKFAIQQLFRLSRQEEAKSKTVERIVMNHAERASRFRALAMKLTHLEHQKREREEVRAVGRR